MAVKAYGEAEFWLSGGKVILIFSLFFFTFITMVGGNPAHDAYGFRYWNNPGSFMEYLDGKLQDKGGLKAFMRHMVDKRHFAPLFVEEFMSEMSTFYGVSVVEDFRRYTFNGSVKLMPKETGRPAQVNPIHRKMTLKELANYL